MILESTFQLPAAKRSFIRRIAQESLDPAHVLLEPDLGIPQVRLAENKTASGGLDVRVFDQETRAPVSANPTGRCAPTPDPLDGLTDASPMLDLMLRPLCL